MADGNNRPQPRLINLLASSKTQRGLFPALCAFRPHFQPRPCHISQRLIALGVGECPGYARSKASTIRPNAR